jgi:ABC-type transport system involved in multi-copper enzyme maturation permease subunit
MMSKPLAILKDSLREAWDSKTLLVMLILATVFLVGVASIGYEPATPKAVIEEYAKDLSKPVARLEHGKYQVTMIRRNGFPYPHPSYTVTTFRTIKEGGHAATGEHEFTILVKNAELPQVDSGEDGGKKKENPPAETPEMFDRYVAAWHDHEGDTVRVPKDNDRDIDPTKWVILRPITDDMVREFFAAELDKETQVPITGFERLPSDKPGERVYKITTGPSAEPRIWPVKFSVAFGAYETSSPDPLGVILYIIQDIVISSIGGLMIILIAVIVTAFFIPNMLRPGSVVMLLSKPISRSTLLLFKFLGGLFFVLILATFVVGGVWLITGIRAGVWAPGIFVVIPLMVTNFAILYSVSTVIAVWSRNSIVCILVTLACAGLLWAVGKWEFASRVHRVLRDQEAALKKEEPQYAAWARYAVPVNQALPRWHDVDVLTGEVVADSLMTPSQQDKEGRSAIKKHLPSWGGTFGVTLIWIALFLGLACWRFSVKDY